MSESPSSSSWEFSITGDFVEQIRAAQGRVMPGEACGYQPPHLCVWISRETGSRGGTIARKVADLLHWDYVDQEKLEYLAQEAHLEQELWSGLPAAAQQWAEDRLRTLVQEGRLSGHPSIQCLARVLLALGCRGHAVILGRGAGYVLPPTTTLLVRIVAPQADRIRYISEFLRLPEEQARLHVQQTDRQRMEFVLTHFGADSADVHRYDLVLNSSLLGVEAAAQVIVTAARYKESLLEENSAAEP